MREGSVVCIMAIRGILGLLLLVVLVVLVEQTRAMRNHASSATISPDVGVPWVERSLNYQRARAHYYQCANEFHDSYVAANRYVM